MNLPLQVEAGRLEGKVPPVAGFTDMREEAVKVDMSLPQREDAQIVPVHVFAAVIVDVVVADMVLLPKPGVFRLIEQVQLAVEIRHLGIEDEADLRIMAVKFHPVGHRVLTADHILDQQFDPVVFRRFVQQGPGPEVVFEAGIGDRAVPEVQHHLLRAQAVGKGTVDLKKAESLLPFLFPALCDMLREGLLAVHHRNIQMKGQNEFGQVFQFFVPAVIKDELKAVAVQLRAVFRQKAVVPAVRAAQQGACGTIDLVHCL